MNRLASVLFTCNFYPLSHFSLEVFWLILGIKFEYWLQLNFFEESRHCCMQKVKIISGFKHTSCAHNHVSLKVAQISYFHLWIETFKNLLQFLTRGKHFFSKSSLLHFRACCTDKPKFNCEVFCILATHWVCEHIPEYLFNLFKIIILTIAINF